MTQQAKFEAAQAKIKAFMLKYGNIALLGETKRASELKSRFYKLQDAAADAYWTDEMTVAMSGLSGREHD